MPKQSLFQFATQPAVYGVLCGLASSVGYTLANICLRSVAHCDPFWVSAVKAAPTVVLIGPWLIVLKARGERVLPSPGVLLALVLAGLLGQLGGNVLFQTALGVVGIALTAPITMGAIIVGGAVLGRLFLREPVTLRMAGSIVVLLAAICMLSLGAGEANLAMQRSAAGGGVSAAPVVALGVAGACLSGLAYAVLGVVIRYGVSGRASLSTTMCTTAVVGLISLGVISASRLGVEGMRATDSADFAMMLLAGVFNRLCLSGANQSPATNHHRCRQRLERHAGRDGGGRRHDVLR